MIGLLLGLSLTGCGGAEPEPPEDPPQALVLNAPVRDGRPPWMLQLLVPSSQADALSPEVLFPALIAAIEPALETCGITSEDRETFVLEGELRLEPGFPGHGGSLEVHVADAQGDVRCVADAANAVGVVGPEGIALRAPMALVLREDATPPPGDAPPGAEGPEARSGS